MTIDCGLLNWAEINPDIFGSMFQSIVDEEMRSTHGMHYTSVPNIMKTIEPLFLDELRNDFDKNFDNKKKLKDLWDRISKIKIFDPACGSGNFLIIAYKELRKLEHAIVEQLIDKDYEREVFSGRLISRIDLDNFYGIEIDDFACEIATLSLYLVKHQMNIEFEKKFGKRIKLIPLKDKAKIEHGNATRIDWQEVCPNKPIKTSLLTGKQEMLIPSDSEQMQFEIEEKKWEEIYLIGNPPYLGFSLQDLRQKEDLNLVFTGRKNYKRLDYISCWFWLGTKYICGSKAKLAFVSTNSICQGEQVSLLWPYIDSKGVEIGFAYQSFKWSNNATGSAGVACVVISLRNANKNMKHLYKKGVIHNVNNINAYLIEGKNIVVKKRNHHLLTNIPDMIRGDMPIDGGNLILNDGEKRELISQFPESQKFIRKFIGTNEILKGIQRWCLWITSEVSTALLIPPINRRIESVKQFRLESSNKTTNTLATKAWRFGQVRHTEENSIIVPSTMSERRRYIPLALVDSKVIVSNLAYKIPYNTLYLFAFLSSKIHYVWVKNIAGKLETRIRYTSGLCFHTFPFPKLTTSDRKNLDLSAKNILFARENHVEKTLVDLYDPEKMPIDLQDAHYKNDLLVDSLYRQKPYESDEERLSDLFKLYEKMIEREKHE